MQKTKLIILQILTHLPYCDSKLLFKKKSKFENSPKLTSFDSCHNMDNVNDRNLYTTTNNNNKYFKLHFRTNALKMVLIFIAYIKWFYIDKFISWSVFSIYYWLNTYYRTAELLITRIKNEFEDNNNNNYLKLCFTFLQLLLI